MTDLHRDLPQYGIRSDLLRAIQRQDIFMVRFCEEGSLNDLEVVLHAAQQITRDAQQLMAQVRRERAA